MFADIVGWSEIADRLDLEDAGDVLRSYHDACAQAVAREGGHVAQFLGDGVMVYFGYPEAHEDDPRRAVRTALDLLEAIKGPPHERMLRSSGLPLRVRIGVHTGLTVVGPSYGLAVGSVPNLAARLQELAEPDSVVVSEATFKLLGSRFTSSSLGLRALKGFDQPIHVYCIESEQPLSMPDSSAAANAPTPFVGREAELARLAALWNDVCGGAARAVAITGDAGIGKTRLISRFVELAVLADPHTCWLHTRGSPTHQNTPFHPLRDLLGRISSVLGASSELEHLSALVEPATEPVGLAALDAARPAKVTQTFGALIRGRARPGPLLIVIEDVHWVDPSTRDVIEALYDLPRVFWLLATRPEGRPARGPSALIELALDRLPAAAASAIVRHLAGKKASEALVTSVLESTDGVPLFVEEQTKMLLESSTSEAYSREIAASLQASLLARLDRLGEAKRVAQFGAVVGRSVSLSMFQRGLQLPQAALQSALGSLVAAGVLLAQSQAALAADVGLAESLGKGTSNAERVYTFKHALVQEAAYQSLLRSDRRRYHAIVAASLEQSEPELVERQPEVLAHHFAQAQDLHRAASYAYAAGRRSMAAAAYREAREHLRTALQHCHAVSETEARRHLELQILSLLGICSVTLEGYGSTEVKATFDRARELARGQEVTNTFHVLRGLWTFFSVVPDFPRSKALSSELELLARKEGDPALLRELGPIIGLPALWCGELAVARAHFEECLDLCGQDRDHALVQFSEDPAMTALALLGWVYWLQGDAARARATAQRAIDFAKRIGHTHSQAYAMAFTSVLLFFLRDAQAAAELTLELEALCAQYEFPTWLAVGQMVRGWALAQTGKPHEALPLVEQSFALWERVGVGLNRPQRLALRAEVKAAAGDLEGALADVVLALQTSEQTGDRYYDAELWRMRGELTRRIDPSALATARAHFEKAIGIASQQGAHELLARASSSLEQTSLEQARTPSS